MVGQGRAGLASVRGLGLPPERAVPLDALCRVLEYRGGDSALTLVRRTSLRVGPSVQNVFRLSSFRLRHYDVCLIDPVQTVRRQL
jgi:hypothetical protein